MHQPFHQVIERSIRLLLAALLALIAALPAGPSYVFAATGAKLRLDITPLAGEINAGETAYFRIELENLTGGPLPGVEMRLPISGPVDKVRAEEESSSEVRTNRTVVRNGGVLWRGDMRAGGFLVIIVSVKSKPYVDGAGASIAINGEGWHNNERDVQQGAAVTVNGNAAVNTNALTLEKSILFRDENGEAATGDAVEIAPKQQVAVQLDLTNESDQIVYSLLVDEMTPTANGLQAAALDADACRISLNRPQVVSGRGMPVPGEALARAGFEGADGHTYGFLIATPPGQTSTVRIRARAVGEAGCEFGGEAEAFVTNLPPTQNGEFDTQNALALLPQFSGFPSIASLIAFLVIVTNDFGDAPDSTNNPGVAMNAYPGVNARFPTSFNPAGGSPPGPLHRNPYPLHLGNGVSWEFSADTGARRNIDPPGNAPNLDPHDDSINVAGLAFQHCIPTVINYSVTANQLAVNALASQNGTAYVNVWLDGNHDGDWEDTLNCDGITAYEHIVVDQAITINAPGTINLVLPTGNIPVPVNGQNEDMWLRISLSDRPSEKVGGGPVGDGRGPAAGFQLGETEDYLYQPAGAPPPPAARGADSGLLLETTIETDAAPPAGVSAAAVDTVGGRYLNTIIRLRNSGDLPTGNVKLVLESQPNLGEPQTSDAKCCRCLTCTVASAVVAPLSVEEASATTNAPFKQICDGNGCRLEADLGYMEPGDSGRVFVRWALNEEVTADVNLTARLVTDGDVNPANDSRQLLSRLPVRLPTISFPPAGTLGWTGCLTCTVAAAGDSLVADFEVRGFAEPNSTVRIFVPGRTESVEVTADGDGFWKTFLNLPDGNHELVAEYRAVNGLPNQTVSALDKSSPLLLTIDSTLPWDPTSLGYLKIEDIAGEFLSAAEADDSCGPWSFQGDVGRIDPNGWRIPVFPGSVQELGVDLTCDGEASAQLKWGDTTLDLTDGDGDGRYTADFAAPEIDDEVLVELLVTCKDTESSYSGSMVPVAPATVADANSGSPIPGVAVTLWQRNEDGGGARFTPWEAQAFGQTNPQTTNDQGHFTFLTPPGSYGLTAQIDGYQTFRAGPFRLQGAFPNRTLPMTPLVGGDAAARVAITDEGFDPPAIEVPAGTVVEWTNTGLDTGSTASSGQVAAADAAAADWDSGQLNTGASYRLRFDEVGVYTYVNAEDPAQQATIIVTETETNVRVFMPIVTK